MLLCRYFKCAVVTHAITTLVSGDCAATAAAAAVAAAVTAIRHVWFGYAPTLAPVHTKPDQCLAQYHVGAHISTLQTTLHLAAATT
jgi:hypothetical protein